jgi:RHS repeat-associated protein
VLTSISGVPGKSTYTIGLDSNGRPDTSTYGATSVATNVVYNGTGQATEIDFGTDKDLFPRDPNTGLMKGWTYTLGSTSETAVLTWNPNNTLNTLAITDGFNSGGTQTCTYSYDDVSRLLTDNCGNTVWNQSYSYDQYNNLTKTNVSNATTWNPGYNSTVTCPTGTICNHITGASYDGNGRLTYDLNNSYAWDQYGKMITTNSGSSLGSCGAAGVICVTYDAFGRQVEKNVGGTINEFLYSPLGFTGLMSGQTTSSLRVPIPGGVDVFNVNGSGNVVEHNDWLGSARLAATLGHTVTRDVAFTPYGENYKDFGSSSYFGFAGTMSDLNPGILYDTPNREFDAGAGGRWLSPDPARASWNAYAYPTNPNSMIDPSGLDSINLIGRSKHLTVIGAGLNPQLAGGVDPFDPLSEILNLDPFMLLQMFYGSPAFGLHTLKSTVTDEYGIQHTIYGIPSELGQDPLAIPAYTVDNSRAKQAGIGAGKIVLGIGLIATVALGDVPGGVAGAVIVASAGIGGAATFVSGTVDVAGAASNTDVSEAQEVLEATGNLPGLVVTDATGGNLKAGQTAATISDAASLALSPKDATKNVFTAVDAGRTLESTWSTLNNAVSRAAVWLQDHGLD